MCTVRLTDDRMRAVAALRCDTAAMQSATSALTPADGAVSLVAVMKRVSGRGCQRYEDVVAKAQRGPC